jgi:hypothetical protein
MAEGEAPGLRPGGDGLEVTAVGIGLTKVAQR